MLRSTTARNRAASCAPNIDSTIGGASGFDDARRAFANMGTRPTFLAKLPLMGPQVLVLVMLTGDAKRFELDARKVGCLTKLEKVDSRRSLVFFSRRSEDWVTINQISQLRVKPRGLAFVPGTFRGLLIVILTAGMSGGLFVLACLAYDRSPIQVMLSPVVRFVFGAIHVCFLVARILHTQLQAFLRKSVTWLEQVNDAGI
ncbi:hypothetical protein DFP72DRAFT_1082870 [Ephemerocybe angulata]|uniref:Uncharacterized protein n=1 Tax=Ephemerocybe angulata TaxID=980116 RepID=A0A8H6H9Y0_9AGAR|nr:hypothetical protein DFP72DRAFT_1082870 [Tulosesus angulatus]